MSDVIVITGAGGFLGSRVVPLMRRKAPRARVLAVVRGNHRTRSFGPGIEMVSGDLRLDKVWRSLPDTVTHVIHLAAAIPWNTRHADRPAVVRALEGTLLEHREGGVTREHKQGENWAEGKETTHWVENRGTKPAVIIVGDVFKP